MSHAIAELLNKPEDLVASAIRKAEDLNGNPSADVRLLANQLQLIRSKIAELGLDPDDTTAEELYQALRVKFLDDSAKLDKALNLDGSSTAGEKIAKVAQLVVLGGHLPKRWLLKPSAIKASLKSLPPKHLMKQLNCRSVDSLLKRESAEAIVLGASFSEPKNWQAKFTKSLKSLGSANFELEELKVVTLSPKLAASLSTTKQYLSDKKIGAVAALPSNFGPDVPTMSIALGFAARLQKLGGTGASFSSTELSPALRWWTTTESLLSRHDDGAVSLNACDVAADLLKNTNFSGRSNRHAAKQMLKELADSYEYVQDKVSESLSAIGYKLADDVNEAEAPAGASLALEYAEAE